jgi:hypothetical protein
MIVLSAAVGKTTAPNVEGQTDGIIIIAQGHWVSAHQVVDFNAWW